MKGHMAKISTCVAAGRNLGTCVAVDLVLEQDFTAACCMCVGLRLQLALLKMHGIQHNVAA